MAFNISNFKDALPLGGSRAGLFRIYIPVPDFLKGHGGSAEKFSLSAQASTIPPGTIEVTEIAYFGRTFKLPGARTFDEWSTTVMIDEDFATRDFIEQWMDRINGNTTNKTTSKGNYFRDLEVHQYAKTGEIIRKYILVDAWPSGLGEVALDWAEGSTVQTFDVAWQFQWWESVATANKSTGAATTVEVNDPGSRVSVGAEVSTSIEASGSIIASGGGFA